MNTLNKNLQNSLKRQKCYTINTKINGRPYSLELNHFKSLYQQILLTPWQSTSERTVIRLITHNTNITKFAKPKG